jgi:hypothetical protein
LLLFCSGCCLPVFSLKTYRTIISSVWYGCETWSLILREEHRFRVCENRALRRILGPDIGEMAGGWGRLHHDDHVKEGEMGGACSIHRRYENPYRIFVAKPEGKRPL